jgi:hypothetical protein
MAGLGIKECMTSFIDVPFPSGKHADGNAFRIREELATLQDAIIVDEEILGRHLSLLMGW